MFITGFLHVTEKMFYKPVIETKQLLLEVRRSDGHLMDIVSFTALFV
jgi:hypothetical protein